MIKKIWLQALAAVPLMLVSACMKDPELKPDFGPEVTSADYSKAMGQLEFPTPYSIKQGEYAYFTQETYLEGRPYNLDRRWAYTVTNKQDDVANNQWVFTYLHELREYVGGTEKVSTNTSNATLKKEDPVPAALSSLSINAASSLKALGKISAQEAPARKTSFHNLKVVKGFYPTPDFVQQRADCGRKLAGTCKDPLKVNVLSYDMVNWEDMQKYHVEWVISPDAPYFGSTRLDFADPEASMPGVLRSCTSTNLPIQGQRVRVTQCDELKDFTFGHP